jgi:hypothetical protein
MVIDDIKSYWKRAAERNIAIAHVDSTNKHFSFFTPEEALADIKDAKYPYLAAELPEIRLNDNLSDNVRMVYSGGVLILKKVTQANVLQIQAAYTEMFPIAIQLVTKLYNDRKKANDSGSTPPESLLKHLELSSINLVEVGPVFDGCHGWRINYQINTPANLDLNESEWTGETKWKF